jgi:hypothetical protein
MRLSKLSEVKSSGQTGETISHHVGRCWCSSPTTAYEKPGDLNRTILLTKNLFISSFVMINSKQRAKEDVSVPST